MAKSDCKVKLGVSLYSYQTDVKLGKMSLEDCFAHIASTGAKGVEIVPEQTLTDFQYETIDEEFVDYWNGLVAKYDLTPTNVGYYDDYDVFPNRELNLQERFARFKHGVKLSKALGMRSIRATSEMPLELLEKCMKYAGDQGLLYIMEIHSPYSMKSTYCQDWLELIDKNNAVSFAGIYPDCGTFAKGPMLGRVRQALRAGAKQDIIDFLQEEYEKATKRFQSEAKIIDLGLYRDVVAYGMAEPFAKAIEMGGSTLETDLFRRLNYDDPRWMLEYKPYIKHMHAKFYNMEPDGKGGFHDPAIDLEGAMEVLREGDFDIFVSTEYEGQGSYMDLDYEGDGPESRDLVEKEQKLMASILYK